MNAEFFEAVRPMFGGSLSQQQVDGFKIIFEAWRKVGSGNERDLAYILATAYHETARTMQPVRETLATTDAKAKERLTKAWKSGKLPWVKSDYWSGGWFGRGFVQLTHRENYVKAGKKLGVDLVSDPSKAMIPEVSALILVRGMQEGWFTGMKLADAADFREARRVVNGTDRASQIAMYADAFLSALDAMDDAPTITVIEAKPSGAGWLVLAALAIAGVVVGAYNWIMSLFG
jgi:hypothetical protein